MKAHMYSITGETEKQVELPNVFNETIRTDLINRASIALRSKRFQPKSNFILAGLQTCARYVGRRGDYHASIGTGRSHLPRVLLPKGGIGDVKRVPQSIGGMESHPPKVNKILAEKINKKENRKAIRSAIAATSKRELVEKRGYKMQHIKEVPIIMDDKLESIKKTREVKEIIKKLKLEDELTRAQIKTVRAGKGSKRGRKYKKKKSILIVVKEDKGIIKSAHNLPGFDACEVKNINVELLAPGGTPGRLTIYTESALKEMEKLFK